MDMSQERRDSGWDEVRGSLVQRKRSGGEVAGQEGRDREECGGGGGGGGQRPDEKCYRTDLMDCPPPGLHRVGLVSDDL